MSSLAHALVTYEQFLRLPDPENGNRYELHDGEVVLVPPAKPIHKFLQMHLVELLHSLTASGWVVTQEYPYRPAPQFQFWYADVAVIRAEVQRAMAGWDEYQCYAPDLVIEVLSPSNRERKVQKQRLASMSHGTREFWVVDGGRQVVTVSTLADVREYGSGDRISVLGTETSVEVSAVFTAPA